MKLSEDIEDHSKQEWYESFIHASADNYQLRELLRQIGQAFSDEIVSESGNYLKIWVDDLPEEMINYLE